MLFRFHVTLSLVVFGAACGGEVTPQLLHGFVEVDGFSAGVAEAQAWIGGDLVAAAPLSYTRRELFLALPPGGPYELRLMSDRTSEPISVIARFSDSNMTPQPEIPLQVCVWNVQPKPIELGVLQAMPPVCRNFACEQASDEYSRCAVAEREQCAAQMMMTGCPALREEECRNAMDFQTCIENHLCTAEEQRCASFCLREQDLVTWACTQVAPPCDAPVLSAVLDMPIESIACNLSPPDAFPGGG